MRMNKPDYFPYQSGCVDVLESRMRCVEHGTGEPVYPIYFS